jgi:hypothetical protein
MIVVNPNETQHTISVVPRYFPENTTDVIIVDGFNSSSNSVTNSHTKSEGKLLITFSFDFISEGRYDVKIVDETTNEIVYRGQLIATTQVTQDYKLTKDKFYY